MLRVLHTAERHTDVGSAAAMAWTSWNARSAAKQSGYIAAASIFGQQVTRDHPMIENEIEPDGPNIGRAVSEAFTDTMRLTGETVPCSELIQILVSRDPSPTS
jgi:hypothetical protein